MDKPIYLGFSVLELSKLHMYETYYDILQPYFGEENLQLHYMDSVTKDTPIILKENENIKILRVDEIIDEEIGIRMKILLLNGERKNLVIVKI